MLRARLHLKFIALLSALTGGLPACEAVAQTRVIQVGIYQNAPKLFIDENGQPSGLFPDILNHIAAQEDWSLQYVPCEWSECLSKIEDESLDLMMDVAYSRERAARFDFNQEVVLSNWSTLYARDSRDISSILDVHDKRIAVVKGSIQYPLFREWALSSGTYPQFVEVETFRQVFESMRDGKAEGGLVNRLFGAQFAPDYGLERTNVVMAPSQLHFVVARNKNQNILAALDRHLAQMKGDPQSAYQQFIAKWITALERHVYPPWLLYVAYGLAGVLLAALVFISALRWEVKIKTAALKRTNTTLRALMAVNETLIRETGEQQMLDSICRAVVKQEDFFMAWVGYAVQDEADPINLIAQHCEDEAYLQRSQHEWSNVLLHGGVLETAIRTGRPVIGHEVRGIAIPHQQRILKAMHDGRVTVSAFPLSVDRRTIGALCLCSTTLNHFSQDIVELLSQMSDDLAFGIQSIRAAQHRVELNKRVQQADKMDALGDLAGGIAHDLKNMLFPIISLTQMTLNGLPRNDRARKRLEKVVEAAERARTLTERIHAFSHTDKGVREEVGICRAIDNCLGILRPAVPSSITIEIECGPAAEQATLKLDMAQFQTVLLNLGSNAADAIGGNTGKIRLSVSPVTLNSLSSMDIPVPRPGPYIELLFSDTGKGMDEDVAHRIFEPYFTTKVRGKGTGLGMSMVQKFIVEHDGGISVSSGPESGTTFRIYLPYDDLADEGPARIADGVDQYTL